MQTRWNPSRKATAGILVAMSMYLPVTALAAERSFDRTLTVNGPVTKNGSTGSYNQMPAPDEVAPLRKPVRRRNKAHLRFVSSQPCLICRRSPCDAHHLKFAQPRTLGRKVSDEFTVPLCRDHHVELHRHGNDTAWWASLQVSPIEVARELWRETLLGKDRTHPRAEPGWARENDTAMK